MASEDGLWKGLVAGMTGSGFQVWTWFDDDRDRTKSGPHRMGRLLHESSFSSRVWPQAMINMDRRNFEASSDCQSHQGQGIGASGDGAIN
jgi:hypothetical protein